MTSNLRFIIFQNSTASSVSQQYRTRVTTQGMTPATRARLDRMAAAGFGHSVGNHGLIYRSRRLYFSTTIKMFIFLFFRRLLGKGVERGEQIG